MKMPEMKELLGMLGHAEQGCPYFFGYGNVVSVSAVVFKCMGRLAVELRFQMLRVIVQRRSMEKFELQLSSRIPGQIVSAIYIQHLLPTVGLWPPPPSKNNKIG